jgi:hypothetical protein
MTVPYERSLRYPYNPQLALQTCDLYFYVPSNSKNDRRTTLLFEICAKTLAQFVKQEYGLGIIGFQGYIDPKEANQAICDGNIPIELAPSNGLATHGMWTHLFGVLMILEYNNATKADAIHILRGLIQPNPNDEGIHSLVWNTVFDTAFGPSSHVQRTPFYLNSILLFRNSILGQLNRLIWEVSINQCKALHMTPVSIHDVVKNQVAAMSTINEVGLNTSHPLMSTGVFKIEQDGTVIPFTTFGV